MPHVKKGTYDYRIRCKRCNGTDVKPTNLFWAIKWFCNHCNRSFFRSRRDSKVN
jgi:hypothetical protein